MNTSKKFPIPVSYFGMALGTLALGLAWRYGATIGVAPVWAGETVSAFGVLVWLILMAAHAVKLLRYRSEIIADWQNSIVVCFISLIPITTILAGIVALPYAHMLGKVMIVAAVLVQLAFSACYVGRLWRGTHEFKATIPSFYLPTVAANFVSAVGMSVLGWQDYGILFLGAGILSWLSLEPAIVQRLRIDSEVPATLRGVIGIQLAPAVVACNTYFAVHGAQVDFIVLLLIGYGILQFLFLVRMLPWVWAEGFNMSSWGFSFGLASMAACGLHLIHANRLLELGYILWIGSSTLIALLWAATLVQIAKGQFWVK